MRCKNCGWPNKPSETSCVKCHSPLSSHDGDESYLGENEITQSSNSLNKTVFESDVFGSGNESTAPQYNFNNTQSKSADSLSQCPKCGYPLRSGVDKCPNCKFQIGHSHNTGNSSLDSKTRINDTFDETHQRPTRMTTDNGSKVNFRGTINPYMMNIEVEPSFVLKPIKRVEERHEFEEQEYEGKQVVLNRENTEKNNPSITSKQQALITNSDGHWYIEDKSKQKTTFVQAAQKIELHDGDIILLGNRLFEFHK